MRTRLSVHRLKFGLVAPLLLVCLPGCIGTRVVHSDSELEQMRIAHYSEYQGATGKVADVVLVESETGGLAVLTDKHIAFYDKDLQFERTVRFKHRYAEFGVIQGPDGKLWFAGYEYWSWMFGIVHRMNFEIHAMPLGNAQPTHTWICKACERLSVLRLSNPSLDILYTVSPGASDRPSSWMFFDVETGESHSVDEFDDIQSMVGAHRIKNEPLSLRFEQSSNDFRYASEEWWMYAFSSCSDVRRKLAGRLEQQRRRCVWHPDKSIVDAQYTLQIDSTYKRLILKNVEETLDSWDLKELVEVEGFSRVVGW